MTNEEAIKRIQQDLDVNKKYLSKEYKEALNMAIEALSADAVSREFYEEAIKANHGLAQELCELKASADRQTIVRCGECKYFNENSWESVNGTPLIVAHAICQFWGNGCKTNPQAFCSFGERKDDTMR